jgi:hypothetical protein
VVKVEVLVRTRKVYLLRKHGVLDERNGIVYKSAEGMREELQGVKLCEIGNKYDGFKCFEEHSDLFAMKGMKFYSSDQEIFSIWQGWKYKAVDEVDMTLKGNWLGMVKEVIGDCNDILYEYIIKWIAFMLQRQGQKNKTAIVLKGLQGIGKGRFTDIIAELTAGYSIGNINRMEDIAGEFNSLLDGKVFVTLNEAKNSSEERQGNFDVLKSAITEEKFIINEKNVPRIEAQNVVNLCISTNNEYAVRVEKGDRRYVVCECNPKYKGDYAYWINLRAKIGDSFLFSITF